PPPPPAHRPPPPRPNRFPAMPPPRHGQLRGLVSRAFTPRRVAELEPRIREIARTHLDRALAGRTGGTPHPAPTPDRAGPLAIGGNPGAAGRAARRPGGAAPPGRLVLHREEG